jgi:Leucine-rich repeat (LRR) protein
MIGNAGAFLKNLFYIVMMSGLLFTSCKKKSFIEPSTPVDSAGVEQPEDTAMFHDTVRLSFAPGFEEMLIFKKIIKDTKMDGFVRYGEIKYVDSLDVSGMYYEGSYRFISIKGIEYFTKLRYLNMSASYVKTLDLTKNTKLEYLDCSGSATDAGWNQTIKKIDVSKCPNLKYLSCSTNQLTTLDVSQNLKLTDLYCYANYLKRIDVSNNRLLRTLDVSVNREMAEIYLTNCPEMERLYLDHNKFQLIDVKALKKLKILTCTGNARDPLFQTLDITNNSQLEVLNISSTSIKYINLAKNSKIKYLDCSITHIKSIDLSNLILLKAFNCANSKLSTVDVSANFDLEFLEIGGTKISTVNLEHSRNLKYFICLYQDHITDIDLTHCKEIQVCQTFGCPNLKTICVNIIPDSMDDKWKTNEWTKYITCK